MVLFNPWLARKRVYTFRKGISPKVNVAARLGFELAYYDVAVLHFSQHSMVTCPPEFYGRYFSANRLLTRQERSINYLNADIAKLSCNLVELEQTGWPLHFQFCNSGIIGRAS